jgi:hypothetical protein
MATVIDLATRMVTGWQLASPALLAGQMSVRWLRALAEHAGEQSVWSARPLHDGHATIGVVVAYERLTSRTEGGQLIEMGVLDRLGAVRRDLVMLWPHAIVEKRT